jgi:hypothetical protein
MANHDPGQTPLLWGLNLFGEARFCRNPHYGGMMPVLGALPRFATGTEADVLIRQNTEEIWSVYFSILNDFSPRRLTDLVVPVVSALSENGDGPGAFTRGLADACAFRANNAIDIFRPVEVMAACIAGLLEQSTRHDVDEVMLDMTRQLLDMNRQALGETLQMLKDDKYSFLSERGGYADFFYLTLRLSRVLGWVGAQHFIGSWMDTGNDPYEEEILRGLVTEILKTYSSSLSALSEVQSPYLLTFIACCRERGWSDDVEMVFGHLFSDFVFTCGRIARPNLEPDRVFEFLMRPAEDNYSGASHMFSRPGEMLSILLLGARWFGLEGVTDPYLQDLDHHSFNVFHPTDHRGFARSTVRDGMNHTYTNWPWDLVH